MRKSNNFANSDTTSMESYFGMLIFYFGFCYCQLHQCGSHQPCEAWLFKFKSEFLLELNIVMKKKLVLYQPFLRKQINLGVLLERGRVGGFPCLFWKQTKSALILDNITLFECIYGSNSHFKCSFKKILEKKQENFSLRSPSFVCHA